MRHSTVRIFNRNIRNPQYTNVYNFTVVLHETLQIRCLLYAKPSTSMILNSTINYEFVCLEQEFVILNPPYICIVSVAVLNETPDIQDP